ncbi:sensor histidine kinase [Massilia sp. RP-1-19]|uniref:Oxygen sensor histidine kinase NreB n=1 Tax=Massilia polaris TaxID=2728846 RepID=A0A848HJ59_9BURK|nr:sensor histidine kinase [Massilia polaris]NML60169.1 sensor histidine kinase [Massilia polaris]
MKRAPRSLSAALVLGVTSAPCLAFAPADWATPTPGLLLATIWLLVIGWGFHTLLRHHLRSDDRLCDAQAQLGVERHARALAERALAETHKVLCRLVEQQEGVRDTERRRIARDIHDDLGQNLMALKIELTLLQHATRAASPQLNARIDVMIRNLDLAIKSLRGIINDLRPLALDAGLRYAMECQLSEFTRLNGIRHHFTADPAAFDTDKAFDAMLFRILQESLSNVARHSQATDVRVALTRDDGQLNLTIRDNGIGLAAADAAQGCGLDGIRDRVAALGGSFAIDSKPGGGCQLSLIIPLGQPIAVH